MKEKYIKPIKINEDVWFYPVKNKLEFTVYVNGVPKLFEIKLSKILKAFAKRGV